MKNSTLLTLSCLLAVLVAPAPSRCEEFLLYTPTPSTGEKVPATPDQGVLVRSITVKPGDTLSGLSKKHIGVGSWFPQVLLFNSIKNPDLIYPGDKLLVPVPPERAASSVKKSTKGKRHHAGRRSAPSRHAAVERPVVKRAPEQVKSERRPATAGEQETYQTAKRTYLLGDYQKAMELLSAFLRRYPDSNLAADASLYRADCLLHLSGR